MHLSEHFTLEELTASETGARAGLINVPSELQILHLKALCSVLEHCRVILGGKPLLIKSGFRSPQVNKLVGGVPTSAHLQGYAADFICPAFGPPIVVAREISKVLTQYDQIIYEYETWVHLSVAPENRRQLLHIRADGKGYQTGLQPAGAHGNDLIA